MTLTRALSVVWGRQKSEEEGLRSEWWLRKWIEGAIFHPWLGFDVQGRETRGHRGLRPRRKPSLFICRKYNARGQKEKVLDSKMFSGTVKEWAEWLIAKILDYLVRMLIFQWLENWCAHEMLLQRFFWVGDLFMYCLQTKCIPNQIL